MNSGSSIGMMAFATSIGVATVMRRYISNCGRSSSSLHKSLASMRQEYSEMGLSEDTIPENPFVLFNDWFMQAKNLPVHEANCMCLSTCIDNKPSSRFVLLKEYDENGFVWFTNYESRKGNELESNPNAAIAFWWAEFERQIRIEGVVVKVPEEVSDSYFHSRPVKSQIGAWSSNQSKPISSRQELQNVEEEMTKRFEGMKEIPRPLHWGGYRLIPSRMEFWKGRGSRMHDRMSYHRQEDGSWKVERLQP